jgi:hypothetical protein
MILRFLQILAAIGTILTGLVSLIRPRSVQGFTGLRADGGRGITEIRAVLGGFFVAQYLPPKHACCLGYVSGCGKSRSVLVCLPMISIAQDCAKANGF